MAICVRVASLDVCVTDLRHFEGVELDPEAPGPAVRFATYLRRIVRAATATSGTEASVTALQCRRRPRHRPCVGPLVVGRRSGPYGIGWQCRSCGDEGVIDGWEGTPDDLSSDWRSNEGGCRVTVIVPEEAYRLLLEMPLFDSGSARMLYAARPCPDGVVLTGGEYDLDELTGATALQAKHAETRDRRRRWGAVWSLLDSASQSR